MGELLDFLVWLKREHDKRDVSIRTLQLVGYYAIKYLELQDSEEYKTQLEGMFDYKEPWKSPCEKVQHLETKVIEK